MLPSSCRCEQSDNAVAYGIPVPRGGNLVCGLVGQPYQPPNQCGPAKSAGPIFFFDKTSRKRFNCTKNPTKRTASFSFFRLNRVPETTPPYRTGSLDCRAIWVSDIYVASRSQRLHPYSRRRRPASQAAKASKSCVKRCLTFQSLAYHEQRRVHSQKKRCSLWASLTIHSFPLVQYSGSSQ